MNWRGLHKHLLKQYQSQQTNLNSAFNTMHIDGSDFVVTTKRIELRTDIEFGPDVMWPVLETGELLNDGSTRIRKDIRGNTILKKYEVWTTKDPADLNNMGYYFLKFSNIIKDANNNKFIGFLINKRWTVEV